MERSRRSFKSIFEHELYWTAAFVLIVICGMMGVSAFFKKERYSEQLATAITYECKIKDVYFGAGTVIWDVEVLDFKNGMRTNILENQRFQFEPDFLTQHLIDNVFECFYIPAQAQFIWDLDEINAIIQRSINVCWLNLFIVILGLIMCALPYVV